VKYFGVTPYQYLTQCRIDEAVRLLLHTDKTIRDIAAACGFAGQSHFSSAIRKRTGMPPGMIRKTGMK
jgi:AraC-like DNA-binding protein